MRSRLDFSCQPPNLGQILKIRAKRTKQISKPYSANGLQAELNLFDAAVGIEKPG